MSKKRLLLFVMGKWSFVNAVLLTTLREQMPDWEVSSVDLLDAFKGDKVAMACSLVDIPFLARHSILGGGGYDKTNVLYFPATSRAINRIAQRLVERHRPDITLQTTTRFNAATGIVPHFTMVDITLALVRQSYRDLYNSTERALNLLDDFQRQVYTESTGVFTMGKYVRDSLVSDYGVQPERAVAVGAGPNIVLGQRSRVVGSQQILYVGSNWARKGGPTLLEAFRRVRHKHPGATLNLIGPSPVIKEAGVNAIGRVPFDQLHRYYTQTRFLALPTTLEAFGNTFVEALHFGVPIVATRIGAIPEMVHDGINGYTVQPGNVEALANALDRLLESDELAARFGEASYRLAPNFTWARTTSLMCDSMLRLANLEPAFAETELQLNLST
jgi:glycosyltransferase involved in cell wall biosynthesis